MKNIEKSKKMSIIRSHFSPDTLHYQDRMGLPAT
jgi:hypothetical protein